MAKIGISGVGRIGRSCLRASLTNPEVEVVAVSSTLDPQQLAHLLTYDSIYGRLDQKIEVKEKALIIDGKRVALLSDRIPANLCWEEHGVETVIEATGKFCRRDEAAAHLRGGAQRVIISAPSPDADLTLVMGVNENDYDPRKHRVISNASCTTNALAPLARVLHENFTIQEALMSTVHAYTRDQQLLDAGHSDLRRARAAGLSIIPTTTGAAKAVAQVLPDLKGRIDGMAIRVPSATVSMVDMVVRFASPAGVEEVNGALAKAAVSPLQGIIDFSEEPLVSIDYRGSIYSATVDALSTMIVNDELVKIVAWFDNEWGYCCRLLDLAAYLCVKEKVTV